MRNIDDAWNETRYYGVNFSSYAELDFGQFWEPLKGVKWRTNLGAQYRNSRVGSYYGEGYTNPFKNPAMAPNEPIMSTVRSCHGHWKTCCISIKQ